MQCQRATFANRIAKIAACGVLCLCVSLTAPASSAQEAAPAQPAVAAVTRGQVTNLPIPRFVSMKASEANLRRGPSLTHRIDWVFRHRGYPLEVIAEYGHWRRVKDVDGAIGWIHYSLISGVRTVIVTVERATLYTRADESTRVAAYAERNAILRILECNATWCRAGADGLKGWVRKSDVWGVKPSEILE